MKYAPGLMLALLLASACGEQREELRGLEQRAADLQAQAQALSNEEAALTKERTQLQDGLEQAQRAVAEQAAVHAQTRSTLGALSKAHQPPAAVDDETRAAMLGQRLQAAMQQADQEGIQAVAAEALMDRVDCTGRPLADDNAEAASDACVGVPRTRSVVPAWSCPTVLTHDDGRAPVAFCTASVDYPGSFNWSEGGLPTRLALIRTARVQDGRVMVADWPPPDQEVFNPTNEEALEACGRVNTQRACVQQCEGKGTACVEACGVGADEEVDPRDAARVTVDANLAGEPASGVYLVEVTRTYLNAEDRVVGIRTSTQLLADSRLSGMRKDADGTKPVLEGLSLLGEAQDERAAGMQERVVVDGKLPADEPPRGVTWMELPERGRVLVMASTRGGPGVRGWSFTDGTIQEVPQADICAHSKAFPKASRDHFTTLCQLARAAAETSEP